MRSVEDPALFYSFGPWRSLEDIQAMRADPGTRGVYQRVLTISQPD